MPIDLFRLVSRFYSYNNCSKIIMIYIRISFKSLELIKQNLVGTYLRNCVIFKRAAIITFFFLLFAYMFSSYTEQFNWLL